MVHRIYVRGPHIRKFLKWLGGVVLSTSRSSAAGDRMFLLGQAFIPAVNARLLGSLLDQSRLVPRVLPPLGFIGAPLLVASAAAVLLGLVERVRAARDRHTPDRAVGVSLTVKGFRPSPITAGTAVNYIE